jgi:tetratricopeptide (TPR) repeat protein
MGGVDEPADDDAEALALVEAIAACRAAPEDDAAVTTLARLATATGRWDDVVSEAARLAGELAGEGEGGLAARWWTRVGGWYATRSGDLEAAMQAYEAAVAADPDAIAAIEALVELYGETGSSDEHRAALRRLAAAVDRDPGHFPAALHVAEAQASAAEAAGPDAAPAAWRDVERRFRDLVTRHAARLSEPQLVDAWLRIAGAARTLGDPRGAEAAFREVIARAPVHAVARAALVEIAEARGDWRAAISLRDDEVAALANGPASAARWAKLHEQIGDVWRDRLADTGAAIAAYEQAAVLAPARGLFHKLLEAFTAEKKWRSAIDMLARLAGEEAVGERRARFHYAAALIARDELAEPTLALDKLTAALDDDPRSPGVLAAVIDALTARAAWTQLARAYRQQITRLGDGDPAGQRALWLALGGLCIDRLGDLETAIAAYQVASELAADQADDQDRERLAELYLAGGPAHRPAAIAELQRLLAAAPGRIELYKALAAQYVAAGALDKAWCVAQVLVLVGAASADEARLFARHRPHGFSPAARRLTEEHWRALAHPSEDRRIGAVFAAAGGAIARAAAEPIAAFGLVASAEIDVARDHRAASRIVAAASRVLAIEPAPRLWLDDGDGVRLANTRGDAAAVPALLVGAAALGRASPGELAFAVGKRLAYVRGERFAAVAVPTVARLEAAFAAALAAPGEGADALTAQLPRPVLDQLADLAARLADREPAAIAHWRAATDLTANRAGFVVANDLDAAVRAIATEGATFSGLTVKDRIRDLLGFAASEAYFALRRHLGQAVVRGESNEDSSSDVGEASGNDPGHVGAVDVAPTGEP